MSKPKHKTVKKWVAYQHVPWGTETKTISTIQIEVVETPNQYRIESSGKEYREAMAAVGYRKLINKASNDCLFDSELAALRSLEQYHTRQNELAQIKARDRAENLTLITEALEKYHATVLV